jgi:hypothetical protein
MGFDDVKSGTNVPVCKFHLHGLDFSGKPIDFNHPRHHFPEKNTRISYVEIIPTKKQ